MIRHCLGECPRAGGWELAGEAVAKAVAEIGSSFNDQTLPRGVSEGLGCGAAVGADAAPLSQLGAPGRRLHGQLGQGQPLALPQPRAVQGDQPRGLARRPRPACPERRQQAGQLGKGPVVRAQPQRPPGDQVAGYGVLGQLGGQTLKNRARSRRWAAGHQLGR